MILHIVGRKEFLQKFHHVPVIVSNHFQVLTQVTFRAKQQLRCFDKTLMGSILFHIARAVILVIALCFLLCLFQALFENRTLFLAVIGIAVHPLLVFRLKLLQQINNPLHRRNFLQYLTSGYHGLKLRQGILIAELVIKIIPDRSGDHKIIGNRSLSLIKNIDNAVGAIAAVLHRIIQRIRNLSVYRLII